MATLAREAGYGVPPSRSRLNQERLQADFIEREEDLFKLWPWLGERHDRGLRWIQKTFNNLSRGKSPFLYAVLASFLARPDIAEVETDPSPADWLGVHRDPCPGVSATTRGVVTDHEVEREVARVAAEMLAERPPVWITRIAFQRRSVLLRTIMDSKRRGLFEPLLAAHAETIDVYRLRKVRLAVDELRRGGESISLTTVRALTKISDLDGLRRWIAISEQEDGPQDEASVTFPAVDDAAG